VRPAFARHSASKTRVNALAASYGGQGITSSQFQTARGPAFARYASYGAPKASDVVWGIIGSRPPSVLSASKSSRRVKRRKALVRNAAPVATLRLGQSLQRKGLPAHNAGRRALRRFAAVISVEPRSTRSAALACRREPLTGRPAELPAHRSLCP
jgi:hypothetical protein